MLSPSATLDSVAENMRAKATLSAGRAWILAMLAGAFIALAGFGATVASCNLIVSPETYGLGRLIAGVVFPIGLVLVVVAGGELFTGNCLMPEAVHRGLITSSTMLRSWILVYLGNFAGALLIAWLLYLSGIFQSANGNLAIAVIKAAVGKAQLNPMQGFILGIFCNWLVCLAVWLATRTDEAAHKAFLIFCPISLFVICGFEHSIANMYYLSAGLLANSDPSLAIQNLSSLTIANCAKNLLFVTLGNIVGGTVFVAGAYAFAYGTRKQ